MKRLLMIRLILTGAVRSAQSGEFHALGKLGFGWTADGGLTSLSGSSILSCASGASSDGSVVVGHGKTGIGDEAFIWDAVNGMRRLQDVLEAGGFELTGWVLEEATGVSADGCTLVGNGENPSGINEAWVAVLAGGMADDLLITDFSADPVGGNARLEWNSISGTTYHVECTDALTNTDWHLLPSLASTSNPASLVHANGLDSSTGCRFYRIIEEP